MIAIVNTMIVQIIGQNSSLSLSNPNFKLLQKKTYESVIDIRKSVDALGGVDFIYSDPAKTRALARLIQADGADVAAELKSIMKPNNDSDNDNDNDQRRVRSSKLRYPFLKNSYQVLSLLLSLLLLLL